jgi:hypothetical protein
MLKKLWCRFLDIFFPDDYIEGNLTQEEWEKGMEIRSRQWDLLEEKFYRNGLRF